MSYTCKSCGHTGPVPAIAKCDRCGSQYLSTPSTIDVEKQRLIDAVLRSRARIERELRANPTPCASTSVLASVLAILDSALAREVRS